MKALKIKSVIIYYIMEYRRTKKEVDALVEDLVERAADLAELHVGFRLELSIKVFTGTGYAGCVLWDSEDAPFMRLARNILVNAPMAQVVDLFHHELAHVFTPEDADHGDEWLKMYKELEPVSPSNWATKCKLTFVREDWRYIGRCQCGRERRRDRRPRADWTCAECDEPVNYQRNPDFNPYGVGAPR
jgi:predicted SprT family Zn-dependent metalloprotease